MAPAHAPADQLAAHESRASERRDRWQYLLATVVSILAVANLAALWLTRGDFVGGWELFGATFGVLAMKQGSFWEGIQRIVAAVLDQSRPVFTGGESLIYGLLPGLLNTLAPWLLWSQLLSLTLFVFLSWWLTRRLGLRRDVYAACVLASPALVSYAIVGYPFLPSTVIPFGLALGYFLARGTHRRGLLAGCLCDAAVVGAIAVIAFNGCEEGKAFFIVPAVAAVTLPGLPLARRLGWLAYAAAVGALVLAYHGGTIGGGWSAVRLDPISLASAVGASLRRYALDWYLDCPALGAAAVTSLFVLRDRRLFWAALLTGAVGLVSLNAFVLGGGFIVPHRYLLIGFVSSLVVSAALTHAPRRSFAVAAVGTLVAAGVVFTSYQTARFLVRHPGELGDAAQAGKIFPLPYQRANLDWFIRPERIREAMTLVRAGRSDARAHMVFYGFGTRWEDSVNPELVVARVLLSLGYRTFTERFSFFDHVRGMFFPFPIRPLDDVLPVVEGLNTPFFVHLHQPEYSPRAALAKYFNRATVSRADFGLVEFESYRVDAFEPPGPIPVQELGGAGEGLPAGLARGFCRTVSTAPAGHYIPLLHQGSSLGDRIDAMLKEAEKRGMARTFVERVDERLKQGDALIYDVSYFDNHRDRPVRARLTVRADDEIAVAINGQGIVESLGFPGRMAVYEEDVLLPLGPSRIEIVYHKTWNPGGLSFASADEDGEPLAWSCDPGFCADSPEARRSSAAGVRDRDASPRVRWVRRSAWRDR